MDNANDCERSIFSFIRKTTEADYKEPLSVSCVNFTQWKRPDYVVGVPKAGTYKRLVTTETGEKQIVSYRAKKGECDGRPYRLEMHLDHTNQ